MRKNLRFFSVSLLTICLSGFLTFSGLGYTPSTDPNLGKPRVSIDFNKDYYSDFAVVESNAGLLYIYLYDRVTKKQVLSQVLEAGSKPVALSSGDFNNDRYPDLVAADNLGNQVLVFRNQGNGMFDDAISLAAPTGPSDVKTTDLNNDGRTDILVCGKIQPLLRTFLAQSPFAFVEYQDLITETGANSLNIIDINEDGLEDVFVAESDSNIYISQGLLQGVIQPSIIQSPTTGTILQLLLFFFYGYPASYFGVPADPAFVNVIDGDYQVLTLTSCGGYSIYNPSDDAAIIYLSICNSSGSLVTFSDLKNPAMITVSAHKRVNFFSRDLFGSGFNIVPSSSKIKFTTLNQAIEVIAQ